MADRVVDPENNEYAGADPVVMALAKAALDEAADKLVEGKDVVPFTMLAVKENIFVETHDYPTSEETYEHARNEVEGARGATGYAFCYDGYLDTNNGQVDCLIAEAGLAAEDEGVAFGYLYDDEGIYRDEITYIGPAPNFMARLKVELEVESEINHATGEAEVNKNVHGMFDPDAAIKRMEEALAKAETVDPFANPDAPQF